MPTADNREKRVVIVDDSGATQAMLARVLEPSHTFKVVGVTNNVASAIKAIDQLRPDIVLIDLCMPYISGKALLEMISGQDRICKIVVSDNAAGNAAMVARLRSIGAAACIAKTGIAALPVVFRDRLHTIVDAFTASGVVERPLSGHDGVLALTPGAHLNIRPSAFGYPIPTDERARLELVRRKQLANAVPERQFDQLTRYVAELSAFPICLMTFIDKDTIWVKSAHGLAVVAAPRCEAFCNYTIAQDDTFIVRDAANDRVFADNPSVTGDPHIRTYVGHPIVTDDGVHAGALCVMDTKTRFVPQALLGRLKGLADIAGEMINRRPLMAA